MDTTVIQRLLLLKISPNFSAKIYAIIAAQLKYIYP